MSEKKESKELTIKDVTASGLSLINEDQFNFLFKKTPANQLYTRPAKGGGQWTYVKGGYVKKALNFISGFNWDFEIIDEMVMLEIGQVIVKGKLKVRLQGQEVVKMQYGRADVKFRNEVVKDEKGFTVYEEKYGKKVPKKIKTTIPLDLGNDLKAAATDCLKKCASEMGVAADVYNSDSFKEVRIDNTPRNINNELITLISDCETIEDLEKLYTENKAEIMKSIDLVNAYGKAKKIFEYEG
jgi:hypothetical protein